MRSYSEIDVFAPGTLRLYETAQRIFSLLPDGLRCHEVARIVAAIMPKGAARVVDGHCGAVDHSWLVVANGERTPVILDVYTVGRLPPVQLVALGPMLPYEQSYRPGSDRTDIDHDLVLQLARKLVTENRWLV